LVKRDEPAYRGSVCSSNAELCAAKRVNKSDPVEHPAIPKIFADQDADAGPPGSAHSITSQNGNRCSPTARIAAPRSAAVLASASMTACQPSTKAAAASGAMPDFPGNYTEEFAERLQCLNPISSPDRSLDQIGGPAMALAGCFVSGVDQDVGIGADHPRSCIPSRVKRCPPIGRPSRIKATMCSIASSCSRESGA
jgi:hypothetical protein